MRQYKPQEPVMTISVTSSEVIAIGHAITQYIHQIERTPTKTKEQLEVIALLRSFQGKVVYQAQNQPQLPLPTSREAQR